MPGRFVVVECGKPLVDRECGLIGAVAEREAERLDDRGGDTAAHVRVQPLSPSHVPGKEFELLDGQHGPSHPPRRQRIGPEQFAAARVSHHDGSRHQVSQPLGPPVHEDAHRTRHPGHRRLQIHSPDQVAKHGSLKGQRFASDMDDPQSDRALARSASAVERFKEEEVPPLREEEGEDKDRSAYGAHPFAQRAGFAEHHAEQNDGNDEDGQIDGQRSRAGPQVGQHVIEPHVLGRVDRDPSVKRRPGRGIVHPVPEEGLEPPTRGL